MNNLCLILTIVIICFGINCKKPFKPSLNDNNSIKTCLFDSLTSKFNEISIKCPFYSDSFFYYRNGTQNLAKCIEDTEFYNKYIMNYMLIKIYTFEECKLDNGGFNDKIDIIKYFKNGIKKLNKQALFLKVNILGGNYILCNISGNGMVDWEKNIIFKFDPKMNISSYVVFSSHYSSAFDKLVKCNLDCDSIVTQKIYNQITPYSNDSLYYVEITKYKVNTAFGFRNTFKRNVKMKCRRNIIDIKELNSIE